MSKILIAGPCVGEHSEQWIVDQAGAIAEQIVDQPSYAWTFKCSFDKANRTQGGAYRGLGLDVTLRALARVHELFGCFVTTDIHEVWQAGEVAPVVDVIQIPAMLSRQTDLIDTAARKRRVNIKLGTTMTVAQADAAVDKGLRYPPFDPWLTYRGTSFGDELVFDPNRLCCFMQYGVTIADVTHSSVSGGSRTTTNARVAAALDVDGLFLECHPDPSEALSDSATQFPIAHLGELLEGLSWAKK